MDWREIQETWRGAVPERGSHVRRARLGLLFELIFAALSIAYAVSRALSTRAPWAVAWAVSLGALFAVAIAYSIWNRRESLFPSSAPPLDFLAQSELRCRRRLALLRFVSWFAAVEAIVSLAIFRLAGALLAGAISTALVCLVALGWLLFTRRSTLRELQRLAELRAELEEGA